ncbi:hypothetical protein L873DRAFT_102402 [Choiromyces venosus 120613-1]|uniref:Uncharacterized protein n=1 Tax=Choiromyces venosus 120613-1 TaxID=1336337 RepID=A0A3N4K3A5_9PEZI|nr:hypothetical protein L873DRAFT_102402 [Choiromyces venosus 120613-1]
MPLGPGSATHIPLLKRAVVLALNWHAGLSFDEIVIKVHINAQTVRRIVNWVKAADKHDFEDVLSCLEDIHIGGRLARFLEGSAESVALGELSRSQKDEEHRQMPFIDIAKELNIYAAWSTLEKVFHNHHGLF